jgi:endonuclease YncB( thermonuclease family)
MTPFNWAAAAIAGVLALPAQAADITGKARVIDGDTLEIAGTPVDLFAIDAPETEQTCRTNKGKPWACGTAARRALWALVTGRTVVCAEAARNGDGRLRAVCRVGRADIGEQMLLLGWALADDGAGAGYRRAQAAAREVREGMWKGKFVPPREWRRTHP